MSALSLYPEMFPDVCTILVPIAVDNDHSGGRRVANEMAITDLPCSVQSSGQRDVIMVDSVQRTIDVKVVFPESPGNVPSGSKILIQQRNGSTPERQSHLTVLRLNYSALGILPVWRADCSGRA